MRFIGLNLGNFLMNDDEYKIDSTDLKILREIQADAKRPIQEIAELVHLSTNACWRRLKLMQQQGIIQKEVALLCAQKLGLSLTVFVEIKTSHHSETWLEDFTDGICSIPEVVEFHRLNGTIDYLLKVVVKSIKDYDRVYKQIIAVAPLQDVSSFFSMETLKETTSLPI